MYTSLSSRTFFLVWRDRMTLNSRFLSRINLFLRADKIVSPVSCTNLQSPAACGHCSANNLFFEKWSDQSSEKWNGICTTATFILKTVFEPPPCALTYTRHYTNSFLLYANNIVMMHLIIREAFFAFFFCNSIYFWQWYIYTCVFYYNRGYIFISVKIIFYLSKPKHYNTTTCFHKEIDKSIYECIAVWKFEWL